jgi:hypothetical protein
VTYPVADLGTVALLNPDTGQFDDSLMPPSIAANVQAAQDAAAQALAAANAAAAAAAQAGGGTDAAAAAAAAAAAQAAAEQAAANAAVSAAAAVTAANSSSSASIAAAVAALPTVARTGSYTDLANKPTVPTSAAQVGAVDTSAVGAASGVAQLDGQGHLPYSQLAAGERIERRVGSGPNAHFATQPLRSAVTTRSDVNIDWCMDTEPLKTAGYAIPGDGWRRETW